MFKSFCVTCRPRGGISEETTDEIYKWLQRHPSFAYAVLEMEGEAKHLHAQLWYDEPKYKGDITKQLVRICERTIPDWDTSQKKVLSSGTKVAYNDWYLNYLENNDLKQAPHIILDKPPAISSPYYPTEEEQEKVKTLTHAVDQRFAKLELDYLAFAKEYELPDTIDSIAKYLYDAMFISRSIKVVINPRDRVAMTTALYHYVCKSEDLSLFIQKPTKSKSDKNIESLLEAFSTVENIEL